MIVIGGRNASGSLKDVQSLQLVPGTAWSAGTEMGGSLAGHSAIFDSKHNRIVVFGGGPVGEMLTNNVYQYSLTDSKWSVVATVGLTEPPRRYHSAIYDPLNQRMIVFGGSDDNGGTFDDVRALSLPAPAETHVWTPLILGVARELHIAIYDARNERMIVFGGSVTTLPSLSYTAYNDVHALSLPTTGAITWTILTPTGTPPSMRDGAAAVYDNANQRMILMGGKTSNNSFSNEVWELSLPVSGSSEWKLLSPGGTSPEPRMRHTTVYDPVSQRLVLFGGASTGIYYGDTWFLGL